LSTVAGYHHKNGEHLKAIQIIDSLIFDVKKNGPEHWLPFFKTIKADNLFELKDFKDAEKNF